MDLHRLARTAGLVGGLFWLAGLVLELATSSAGAADAILHWTGFVLLAVALVGAGVGLVSSSAPWLRAIVAVAFPLLVWSVLEVLHPTGNPRVVDGIFGSVMSLVALAQLVRGHRRSAAHPRSVGAHAR